MSFDLDKLCHAQRERLTFIESVAFWEGAVDRARVTGAFSVSENHVTKDFRLYKDVFPGNLQYDESSRVYRPSRKFKPRIGRGSPDEYLALLRANAEQRDLVASFTNASTVQVDAVPLPVGLLDASILNAVTRAIAARKGLEIKYQSLSTPQPSMRRIWPHALAFGGTRWHARAFDDQRRDFIDLVLQRILEARPLEDLRPYDGTDTAWDRTAELDIVPSRALSASQAATIANEYGMAKMGRDWIWRVKLKECLAGYFIRLHRLDLEKDPTRLIELRTPNLAARYRFSGYEEEIALASSSKASTR